MGFFNNLIKLFKGSDLKNTEDRSNDPNNIKALEKRFRFFNLDSKFDQIKPLIRDQISLHLTPSAESSFVEGESKIGGMPDLPSTISWPKNLKGNSLSFIGQINLTDLSKVYLSNLLPLQGTLYFFYSAEQEAWGFDPNDKDQFSVIYDDSDAVKRRIDLPDDIDAFSRFKPNKIKFEHRLSVHGW